MRKNRPAALLLAAAICVLAFFSGCGAAPQRFEGSFLDVFDTVTKVVIYENTQQEAEARFEAIHALLIEYHKLSDIYNEYEGVNNAATINANAGKAPVAVDEKLIDLLEYAKEMYAATDGKMNIAMGSVLSVWHEYREEGIADPENAALPPMETLREAAGHTDIDKLVIDRAAGTVYLADEAMSIDLGAIAKGYAAQRVVEAMKAEGVSSLLLSVGGNVCSIGGRADGKSWKVQVESPWGGDALATVGVNDLCLVTSGNYQRRYEVDGQYYHHIIDPETLMPSLYFASVTVLAADSGMADALSTALFNMSLEEGQKLANAMGVDAYWVDNDGTETMTDGFRGALAEE